MTPPIPAHSRWPGQPLPLTPIRVGIFIDGMTFKIISDYYRFEHSRHARPGFEGIDLLAQSLVGSHLKRPAKVSQKHLFMGVRPGPAAGLSPGFEQSMRRNSVTPHYLPMVGAGEKGVDTALTLEMYRLAITKQVDAAVLVATDGDFAPLALEVRALGVPVYLLGFHLPNASRQPVYLATALRQSVSHTLSVSAFIDSPAASGHPMIDRLFYRPASSFAGVRAAAPTPAPSAHPGHSPYSASPLAQIAAPRPLAPPPADALLRAG